MVSKVQTALSAALIGACMGGCGGDGASTQNDGVAGLSVTRVSLVNGLDEEDLLLDVPLTLDVSIQAAADYSGLRVVEVEIGLTEGDDNDILGARRCPLGVEAFEPTADATRRVRILSEMASDACADWDHTKPQRLYVVFSEYDGAPTGVKSDAEAAENRSEPQLVPHYSCVGFSCDPITVAALPEPRVELQVQSFRSHVVDYLVADLDRLPEEVDVLPVDENPDNEVATLAVGLRVVGRPDSDVTLQSLGIDAWLSAAIAPTYLEGVTPVPLQIRDRSPGAEDTWLDFMTLSDTRLEHQAWASRGLSLHPSDAFLTATATSGAWAKEIYYSITVCLERGFGGAADPYETHSDQEGEDPAAGNDHCITVYTTPTVESLQFSPLEDEFRTGESSSEFVSEDHGQTGMGLIKLGPTKDVVAPHEQPNVGLCARDRVRGEMSLPHSASIGGSAMHVNATAGFTSNTMCGCVEGLDDRTKVEYIARLGVESTLASSKLSAPFNRLTLANVFLRVVNRRSGNSYELENKLLGSDVIPYHHNTGRRGRYTLPSAVRSMLSTKTFAKEKCSRAYTLKVARINVGVQLCGVASLTVGWDFTLDWEDEGRGEFSSRVAAGAFSAVSISGAIKASAGIGSIAGELDILRAELNNGTQGNPAEFVHLWNYSDSQQSYLLRGQKQGVAFAGLYTLSGRILITVDALVGSYTKTVYSWDGKEIAKTRILGTSNPQNVKHCMRF